MSNKSYVGVDPSFLHGGVTIINEQAMMVFLKEFGATIAKNSTLSIFQAIPVINGNEISYIISHTSNDVYLGEEISRSFSGYMASELYALDYDLYCRARSIMDYHNINIYSNGTLSKSLLGHKSSEKEKTIFLVEDQILPIFEKHGYTIIKDSTALTKTGEKEKGRCVKRETITDGNADAMIYALRQFVLYSDDENLKKDILWVLPNLTNCKEIS